jgi:transposase, IS5 family
MIREINVEQGQLFATPFEQELDLENRWIKFSKILPWNKLNSYYYSRMDKKMGAGTIDARIVLGAVIIKHHEGLSDEGTIESIKENLYMQYFLGLPTFKRDPVFAPSLFVEIRKRLGLDYWQEINEIIVKHNTTGNKNDSEKNKDKKEIVADEKSNEPTNQESGNKGTINIDATIVEQDIQYPTDLGILNESREKSEEIIDTICLKTGQKKPRTYRIKARKNYLNVAKKKRRTHKEIRKAVKAQLNYVSRDLKHIESLLMNCTNLEGILNEHQLKYLQVINEVYRQQNEMHTNKTHSTPNRIVSIHQPHVRPMVRGKAGSNVEFGSKIGVCVHNGLTYLDRLSWDSYNETEDLKISAENYKKRNGYYPAKINADQIYITRENRKWCKEREILLNGKPLGRPTEQSKERIKELRESVSERNCVEGKFGQGKRWYGMGNIFAKLKTTSESMIGAIVVVLNLIRLVQQHALTFMKFINYIVKLVALILFIKPKKALLFE